MVRLPAPLVALVLALVALAPAGPLRAQAAPALAWDAPEALDLVRRAALRRRAAQADSGLRGYRARAHGFVFFLAQVGEGLREPPRLAKADELRVEVYWQPPDRSKQRIVAWREGNYLPYGTDYHRDHLGIVANNFGDRIGLGEGDEVRDVVHPLAPGADTLYAFAVRDSLAVQSPAGTVRVLELAVRPRDPARPAVTGALFLDADAAEVVRFQFGFTRAAYLDPSVEDITVVLEQGRSEERWWLPIRQQLEIRRRSAFLDFPARTIIRAKWLIDDYAFGVPTPPELLLGPEIGGLRVARRGDAGFDGPLDAAIAAAAAPVTGAELAAVRRDLERVVSTRLLAAPRSRPGIGAVSDLVRVNRVQGLALGAGATFALGGGVTARPRIGFGTSDARPTGGLALDWRRGGTTAGVQAERRIRDFADAPITAPVLNTLAAQELGDDWLDWVLVQGAGAFVRHARGRLEFGAEAGVEDSRSLAITHEPARGRYRANPALGAGTYGVARARVARTAGEGDGGVAVALGLEAGTGPTDYLRGVLDGHGRWSLGGPTLETRWVAGVASTGVPRWRTFALGGRGTLVGEPHRAWGGRAMLHGHMELRLDVGVPELRLGRFAGTGRTVVLAPFVAAGWAGGEVAGVPWLSDGGVRPVAGVAAEWLMGLVRVEAGIGLRTGRAGVTVDVSRAWWGVL